MKQISTPRRATRRECEDHNALDARRGDAIPQALPHRSPTPFIPWLRRISHEKILARTSWENTTFFAIPYGITHVEVRHVQYTFGNHKAWISRSPKLFEAIRVARRQPLTLFEASSPRCQYSCPMPLTGNRAQSFRRGPKLHCAPRITLRLFIMRPSGIQPLKDHDEAVYF